MVLIVCTGSFVGLFKTLFSVKSLSRQDMGCAFKTIAPVDKCSTECPVVFAPSVVQHGAVKTPCCADEKEIQGSLIQLNPVKVQLRLIVVYLLPTNGSWNKQEPQLSPF